MAAHRIFKAFFSYARHDAIADPSLVEAFTDTLEKRVNAKLTNARFAIWRDVSEVSTGDRWNETIESEVRNSDILIVLLTPRWIESDYCRKEYAIFERVEATRNVGEYVVPILARSLKTQAKHFTDLQRDVYQAIASRQFRHATATEFMTSGVAGQIELVDKLADDIEGMIERLRVLPAGRHVNPVKAVSSRTKRLLEFDGRAQNYEKVDFVSGGEVVLRRRSTDDQSDVLAHVGFIERLYVQGKRKRGRVEFGVRRAFVSVENSGSGTLSQVDELKRSDSQSCYYTTLHEAPQAVTVCMDPPVGRTTLAELPLTPAKNENYLSKMAIASADVTAQNLRAELIVSLDIEGLYLADVEHDLSPQTEQAIKAIIEVARQKLERSNNQKLDKSGNFRRALPIEERS
jgi:hypothetical protein